MIRILTSLIVIVIIAGLTPAVSQSRNEDSIKDLAGEFVRMQVENLQDTGSQSARRVMCDSSLSAIYLESDCSLFWPDRAGFLEYLKLIVSAEEDGLNPEDYHYSRILELYREFDALNPEMRARLDVLATDGILLYASHMLSGKLDPASVDAEWHVVRGEADVSEVVRSALLMGEPGSIREKLRPGHDTYHGLLEANRKYRTLQKAGGWKPVEPGPLLKPGMEDERIRGIKDRLVITGDLSASRCQAGPLYDSVMLAAVQRFQARHGLEASGTIGDNTIAAMNVPVEQRLEQIRVNLERWRWLPRTFADFYMKVNIASYYLEVFRNGELVRRHRIMVGRPTRKTPVFASTMRYLVLNPTWTVPPGILRADVIPAQRKNSGYLAGKGISVIDRNGNVLDAASVDWNSREIYSYTYRQAPGRNNALGSVKFIFDNSFNVYLHDTPSKELFASEDRAFSSGCIRVEDPLELAGYLLEAQPVDRGRMDAILKSGRTETIFLDEKPEVYLLYWTAWTGPEGEVHFRKDIYERDGAVAAALAEEAPV